MRRDSDAGRKGCSLGAGQTVTLLTGCWEAAQECRVGRPTNEVCPCIAWRAAPCLMVVSRAWRSARPASRAAASF